MTVQQQADNNARDNNLLEGALELAEQGACVFPLPPLQKKPWTTNSPQGLCTTCKYPHNNGWKDATSNLTIVRYWWTAHPDANVGMAQRPSGCFTFDIDPDHGGDASLALLLEKYGALPNTLTAKTRSGGRHYVFKQVAEQQIPQKLTVRPGIDIIGNGYILVEPSVVKDAETGVLGRYEWLNPGTEPLPAPAWLLELAPEKLVREIVPVDFADDAEPTASERDQKTAREKIKKLLKELADLTPGTGELRGLMLTHFTLLGGFVGARRISYDELMKLIRKELPWWEDGHKTPEDCIRYGMCMPVEGADVTSGWTLFSKAAAAVAQLEKERDVGQAAVRQAQVEGAPEEEVARLKEAVRDVEEKVEVAQEEADAAASRAKTSGVPDSPPVAEARKKAQEAVRERERLLVEAELKEKIRSQCVEEKKIAVDQLGAAARLSDARAALNRAKEAFEKANKASKIAEIELERALHRQDLISKSGGITLSQELKADPTNGKIYGWLSNDAQVFRDDPFYKHLQFDEFGRCITWLPPDAAEGTRAMRVTGIQMLDFTQDLQRRYNIPTTKMTVKDALEMVAQERGHKFDSLVDHLTRLPKWDEHERIDTLAAKLYGDTRPIAQKLLAKWLISAVARAFIPGCPVHGVLLLMGAPNAGKSYSLRVLAGQFFGDEEIPLNHLGDRLEAMNSAWIHELSELATLHRGNLEQIKAWISRPEDRGRAAYGFEATRALRRCVMAGSTNKSMPLIDDTGNRRWWTLLIPPDWSVPINVPERLKDQEPDPNQLFLKRDRDQIWAEAIHWFNEGEKHSGKDNIPPRDERLWMLTKEENAVLDLANRDFEAAEDDPVHIAVGRWLASPVSVEPKGANVFADDKLVPLKFKGDKLRAFLFSEIEDVLNLWNRKEQFLSKSGNIPRGMIKSALLRAGWVDPRTSSSRVDSRPGREDQKNKWWVRAKNAVSTPDGTENDQ